MSEYTYIYLHAEITDGTIGRYVYSGVASTRESHERAACISRRSAHSLSRFHVDHCGRCIILTLVVISGLPATDAGQ